MLLQLFTDLQNAISNQQPIFVISIQTYSQHSALITERILSRFPYEMTGSELFIRINQPYTIDSVRYNFK